MSRDAIVNLRVAEQVKAEWKAAASARGMSVADFVRECVRLRIERDLDRRSST